MRMVEHDDGCEARSALSIERRHLARRACARAAAAAVFPAVPIRHPAHANTADFERLAGASGAEPQFEQTIESGGGRGGPHEIAQLAANGVSEPCLA